MYKLLLYLHIVLFVVDGYFRSDLGTWLFPHVNRDHRIVDLIVNGTSCLMIFSSWYCYYRVRQKEGKQSINFIRFTANETSKYIVMILTFLVIIKGVFYGMYMPVDKRMSPTIEKGDVVRQSWLPYLFREPTRGEIVEIGQGDFKRVIGLPGERLQIRRGKLYINGKIHKEPYLSKSSKLRNTRAIKLKNNQYALLYDDGYHRTRFDILPKEKIVSKVLFNGSKLFDPSFWMDDNNEEQNTNKKENELNININWVAINKWGNNILLVIFGVAVLFLIKIIKR